MKELEEQMQLAVEESDLQRKTSLADHERMMTKLRERIEELETVKMAKNSIHTIFAFIKLNFQGKFTGFETILCSKGGIRTEKQWKRGSKRGAKTK